jgi:Spy/CpxP family protein refolding chaperone
MNLQSALLLPGTLALSLTIVPVSSAIAQSSPSPTTPPLEADLRLNDAQREAIGKFGDIMFDQIDTVIDWGLERDRSAPPKINRETEQELRDIFQSLNPDDQQRSALRKLVQTARQVMQRQLETALPGRK